jgi:hypothetical protein
LRQRIAFQLGAPETALRALVGPAVDVGVKATSRLQHSTPARHWIADAAAVGSLPMGRITNPDAVRLAAGVVLGVDHRVVWGKADGRLRWRFEP